MRVKKKHYRCTCRKWAVVWLLLSLFRSGLTLRDYISLSLETGSNEQTYKIHFAVCTHAGSLAAGKLTQFPCLTASCSCSGCSEPVEPAGGTLPSAVSDCWMRAAGWMKSWELESGAETTGTRSGREKAKLLLLLLLLQRRMDTHRSAVTSVTEVSSSASAAGLWLSGAPQRWSLDAGGRDRTDTLQAAAVCVQRLAVKPPPLENKASGSGKKEETGTATAARN